MRILVDKDTFNILVVRYRTNVIRKLASFKRMEYYVLLLSKEGILRRVNGTLERVVINDGETRLIKFNNYEFIGDTSAITYITNNELQLPTQITEIPVTTITFKLCKNSVVSLNYEMLGTGDIRDAWFEIDDSFVDNIMAMEDIDTFICK